jgi:hypothetical protein
MKEKAKQLAIGASMAMGAIAIASTSAFAYTITGNNDYLIFDICSSNQTCLNQNANIDSVLTGNSSAPGGNIELFASAENYTLNDFLTSNDRTNIEGTVAGQQIVVSSLTATDWFGPSLDTSYTADTLATQWFNAFYQASGLATKEASIRIALSERTSEPSWLTAPSSLVREAVYTAYLSDQVRGFQRSSDPNVSYITTHGSDLLIGLAGHIDAKNFYTRTLGPLAVLIDDGFQVSEVVKVSYGGVEKFLYSFSATPSGLSYAGASGDGTSHTGNYEVKLAGVVTSVPEPSFLLGMMGLGGFFLTQRKIKK